jgi:hypothetical protein
LIFAEGEPKFFALHLQPRIIRAASLPSMSLITANASANAGSKILSTAERFGP